MKELKNRVAVVTGAASGIGLAMCERFAREGMRLVMADIEDKSLAAAHQKITALGAQAITQRVDVRSEEQVNALAEKSYSHFGEVNVVCNNAGVTATVLATKAWESSLADWNWVLSVNFMGVLYGVRAFVPRMLAAGTEGHVVNTASVAGLLTGANPYNVSKNGVTCLTEGLYKDLRSLSAKVSASVLCPGLIRTQIMDAERNRPADFGPANELQSQPPHLRKWAEGFRNAIEAGYEPSVVADAVAEAVIADKFYIVPAQQVMQDLIRTRMQDIIEQRNPTVPPPRW